MESADLASVERRVWDLDEIVGELVKKIGVIEDLEERVEVVNGVRRQIHQISPFKGHPVDLVQWVKAELVEANDYNPNTVARPEMELLELSIQEDGYTQPVVTWIEERGEGESSERRETIDGFHRGEVGRSQRVRLMVSPSTPRITLTLR